MACFKKPPPNRPIDIAGKQVAAAWQVHGDHHPLDGGYDEDNDGDVIIQFTDGTELRVWSYWCNDQTSSMEFGIAPIGAAD